MDLTKFLGEIGGGVFEDKVGTALSMAASGAINNKGTAKVTIEFSIERIGESAQVSIDHKLKYTIPTQRGKKSEEDTTNTPMYVGVGGKMTLRDESTIDIFDQARMTSTTRKELNNVQ